MKKNNGFTLIEILFSLLIVGITVISLVSTIKLTEVETNQKIYENYAYIIISNTLNNYFYEEKYKNVVEYNNIKYYVEVKTEPAKLSKLIKDVENTFLDNNIKIINIIVKYEIKNQEKNINWTVFDF